MRTDLRDSTQFDIDAPSKDIDINAQEITTTQKRIELAEKYFEIKIQDATDVIKRQSLYTTEKLLSDFPISVIEVQ